jgi:Flp pilus assembly protein TadD
MSMLHVLFAAIALLQITPGYRAQQFNAEGIRLMQQDRPSEAESQFRQAVQADPSNLEAVTNLGVAIFKQGRFRESIPFFEQGVASRPEQAALHNDLARRCRRAWGDSSGSGSTASSFGSLVKSGNSGAVENPEFVPA